MTRKRKCMACGSPDRADGTCQPCAISYRRWMARGHDGTMAAAAQWWRERVKRMRARRRERSAGR